MRLATARDEFAALNHAQVRKCPDYLVLVMLSQVITQIGDLSEVSPLQLEGLFTQDLAYLKAFYSHLNQQGYPYLPAQCPDCDHTFNLELSTLGETLATPPVSSTRR